MGFQPMINIRLACVACTAALIGLTGAAGTADATGPSSPSDQPNPSLSSSQDSMYLDALTRQGITYSSPHAAIKVARYVCAEFANGDSFDTVAAVGLKNTSLPPDSVRYIIGAATSSYCPQYLDEVPGS
jgi:Protein of unknown function (DUF732)